MRGLRALDRLLRGEATEPAGLARDGLAVPLRPVLGAALLLAAGYGVCMGVYGVAGRPDPEYRQAVAAAVKVPALLAVTLVVTFPSLYVFTALCGSRLGAADVARLLAGGVGVLAAVLAGLGPIVAFFSVTTTSYPFVVLLNVAVFAAAGGFGVAFVQRAVERLTAVRPPPRAVLVRTPPDEPGSPAEPRVREVEVEDPPAADDRVRVVFRVWLVVFALVGAQTGWVLRPFIGSPAREFAWFRPREGSFFEGVARAVRALFT
ncbi:MAG: hypothetical protein K2X82_33610 [Gemmataceae bacterium]|nr:hypothetical protein [Gemmataceae bacterium]